MIVFNRRFTCFLALACLCLNGCGGSRERPADHTPLIPADKLANTDILPYSQGPIAPGRNYVYCSTFQIVWAEMQRDLAGGPLELKGDPEIAVMLNRHPFDPSNLSKDSYLAMGGRTDQGIVTKIRQAMAERFPQASLNVPDPPANAAFYAFAYLVKSAQFREAFDRLEKPLKFGTAENAAEVAAFGVGHFEAASPRDRVLLTQMSVLDYQDEDDFIISLNTTSQVDEIVLAKIKPEASLQETIDAVEKRIENSAISEFEHKPRIGECLMIPIVSLGAERVYREIMDIPLQNPGLDRFTIADARQAIRFRLDEWGAKLESSATEALKSAVSKKHRRFVFDKPFLIYFKEKTKAAPYFALWIETPELLEKAR